MNITQKRLKELLHYEESSGQFTRTVSRNKWLAGQVAGTIAPAYNTSYVRINVDGKIYAAHRLAWLYMYGEWPNGHIDHIDHNGLNNQIENLRIVTMSENHRNRTISKVNKSGILGVFRDKKNSRWTVSIRSGKDRIHLYCGTDFFEACCAKKSAERKYNYHPNHGSTT